MSEVCICLLPGIESYHLCRIMRAYMPLRGTLGHDMMFRSCTIQVLLCCSLLDVRHESGERAAKLPAMLGIHDLTEVCCFRSI